MLVGTLVVRDGSNGVEISWNNFQEVQVVVWVPQIWLRIPRKGPKWPKNAQNLILSTLVVQNGWNGVERSRNELQEVQVEVFYPGGSGAGGVPPILAKERPRRPKNAQNLTLSTLVVRNCWNERNAQKGFVVPPPIPDLR